jgi:hypothetical protein
VGILKIPSIYQLLLFLARQNFFDNFRSGPVLLAASEGRRSEAELSLTLIWSDVSSTCLHVGSGSSIQAEFTALAAYHFLVLRLDSILFSSDAKNYAGIGVYIIYMLLV